MKTQMAAVLGAILATLTLSATADQRMLLPVSELQRDHVLSEMRMLLGGVQRIVAALGDDDMAAVAEAARPLGLRMAHKAEDHLKGVLPAEFMRQGMAVHQDFDDLADSSEFSGDSAVILRQLGRLMEKCVACHNTYQLRLVAPEEKIGHEHHRQ